MFRRLLARIMGTFRRRRLEDEFDEEVRLHLEMLAERFAGQGIEPREAFYAARRQFGGVTQVKENHRDRRALPPVDVLVQDFRHAFRQLRKTKGFTASAAITLALGIGACTAIFAVLDTVVLRPLPYSEPGQVMDFSFVEHGVPGSFSLSYPTFFDLRKQNRVFDHLVCYRDDRFTLSDSLPAVQVAGEIVAWDLFPLLGVQPQLGRGFLPEEERPGTRVVVLSDALWKSRFGADRGILGKAVRIESRPFVVVGVAPPGFAFPVDLPSVQLWTTLAWDSGAPPGFHPMTEQRGARLLNAVGRLKPRVTPERAQAQMNSIAGALAQQYPDENKHLTETAIRPELEKLTGKSRKPLWILLGAVGLVLLIACANVANLLVARSIDRTREFALRTAVGASRGALVRQLLIESLALGIMGTAGGVLLGFGALRGMLPLAGDSVPRIAQAGIDLRVLGFSAFLAIMTSMLFSVAPAFDVMRADLAGALKESSTNVARGHHHLRSGLVVGQIALGLVLLMGAELLMTTFLHLARRDPGFRSDHLLVFDVGVPSARYHGAGEVAFCDRLLDRMRAIPGVVSAATGSPVPLEGSQMAVSFDIEERRAPEPDRPRSDIAIVTPGYFATLGIPVLRGRNFTEHDDDNAPPVLVVNEAFAQKYFPGEDVIGKRIEPGAAEYGKTSLHEIVGVVANAKQVALTAGPDPIYYFPYKQLSWFVGTIVLRTAVPPLDVASAARSTLSELDREVPMYKVRTGEDLASAAIAAPRFLMSLMASFAAIALLLTIAGLYGVLSYAVARRRREIGLRIAVGAGRREVIGLVLGQALRLVAIGLGLGLAGAIATGRLLESALYGIRPGGPAIIAGACGALLICSLAAAYIPAARAAAVDPMRALRSE